MTNEASETITVLGVFGASGRTGKYVVEHALELGWRVKAMVRTPSKFDIQHDHLTVIQGDFSNNTDAIKETVRGATYVISCADGPHNPRQYEKGFMEKFVREQLWPALQESKPKACLFQAGALSKLSTMPTFGQLVVAPMLGLWPMAKDNDAVMRFIDGNPLEGTRVTITRPGALIPGRGGSALRTSCMAPMAPITFADLGKSTVQLVEDEGMAGKYPYIARKYGF